MKRTVFLLIAALLLCADPFSTPRAMMQSEGFTLAGEWIVDSTPIDGQNFSRLGNTLGFPQRDMVFSEEEGTRTGFVKREDVGTSVNPLGVWRVTGNRFSATFQLWCPNTSVACGTVIMRGRFVEDGRIRGTMTVFFDAKDSFRPTGYDTWVFSFQGDRLSGGAGI